VRQVVDRKARALGITPALAVTTNSIAMTRSLVRMGDLATILPYVSVRHDCRLGLLKAVTIAKPDSMNAEIDLCVRKDRPLTASVKGMLAALSETFDSFGGDGRPSGEKGVEHEPAARSNGV